jgi:hypothetical protein
LVDKEDLLLRHANRTVGRLPVAGAQPAHVHPGLGPLQFAGNRAVARLASGLLLQPKLAISQPGDPLEQEADRFADQVMRMPEPALQRTCSGCGTGAPCAKCTDGEEHVIRRTPVAGTGTTSASAGVLEGLGGGRPLDAGHRPFFESRFGCDLGAVRIHDDAPSHRLAASLQARAFTVGGDVFFHRGEYQPGTATGRRLLAHELVHTVQQRAMGRAASPRRVIQLARFNVGSVTVQVDFSSLHAIADADLIRAIETRFMTFTAAPDAAAIHASLTALTLSQRRWVLYAVDLLQDNTRAPLHNRLNRTTAVQRLIAHAPLAASTFFHRVGPAEEEALRVAGWFEVALAAGLSPAAAADRAKIHEILNPPLAGGPGAALKVVAFHARMDPAVRHLIGALDPANWPTTGTQTLATLQSLGDELMGEAREFFSPFAHTARTSVFGLHPPFHISANIFSVTAMAPTRADRLGYLRNRATIVGWNTLTAPAFSDQNIFRDVNFDGTRPTDRAQFESLVTSLEADSTVAAAVDRLILHTGRQSGSGVLTRIGLSTEFNASSQTQCQARWSVIETLCHEIMHALAHPSFVSQTANVGFGQVLLEGVPEVLATQMFNQHVKPKAAGDPAFKARMEAGITPPACPAPPNATIGYGAAGAGAEQIRTRPSVGNAKFRAAFFLGQVHLLGL